MKKFKALLVKLAEIWPDIPEPIQELILERLNRLAKPMYIRCPFGRVPRYKPVVPVATTCPACRKRFAVAIRSGGGFYCRFWYCQFDCGWSCWRPPAPMPCSKCKGPTIWSASRLSYACFRCGFRERI